MEIIREDAHVMDLAKRSAVSFCRNHHPWGMDVDDVLSRIWEAYANAEWEILCFEKDSPEREAAAKAVIARVLNGCKDESKANRARIQPYQIRKALERGEDIDRAWNRLGNDMAAWYGRGNSEAQKHRYLKIALRHMQPADAAICRAYCEEGSWEVVAKKFGYSEGSFRRNVLPSLAKRAKAVWEKVW